MRLVTCLLLVACGRGGDRGDKTGDEAASHEVTGSLALDGKPLVVTQCRAGRGVTTYVELTTQLGKLRFEDRQLFWAAAGTIRRGDPLHCDKLDRSWGGGLRRDGTSYFRGHLIFACRGPLGEALTGDVQVDCGGITSDERKALDKNRDEMRNAQQGSGG